MSLLMKFLPYGLAGSLLPIYDESVGLWPRFVRRSLNIFLLMFIYMKRPLSIDLAVFLSERGDPLAERWSEKNRAREREREITLALARSFPQSHSRALSPSLAFAISRFLPVPFHPSRYPSPARPPPSLKPCMCTVCVRYVYTVCVL